MVSFVKRMRTFVFALVVAASFAFANGFYAQAETVTDKEDITIVVTLRPLHSLVSMVMEDIAEPQLLLDSSQDPHHFALRPSHARLLSEASVVFYLNDGFELFIPPLKETHDWRNFVELSDVVPASEPQSDHHWLNPATAIDMLTRIQEELSFRYPFYAEKIEQNAVSYKEQMSDLSKNWQVLLPPAIPEDNRYMLADHDFMTPLTRYFQQHDVIALKNNAGALRVKELKMLDGISTPCLFITHPADAAITKIAKQTGARIVPVDPLGIQQPTGTQLAINLIDDLAQRYGECLN